MKYCDYAEQYFENQKPFIKESTMNAYLFIYDNHIKPYFADYDINNINSRVAQKFINYLSTKESRKGGLLTKKSIIDIMVCFKMIMHDAMREGMIPEFTFKVKYPNDIYDPPQELKILKDSDYQKLLKYCKDNINWNTVGIMLALCCGLRIGEICGLKWGKVDFDGNNIYVDTIVNRITDARGGGSVVRESSTKTRSSTRYIPMTDVIRECLLKWRNKEYVAKDDYYVLRHEKPREPRGLREQATRILKSLGIDYIHFHNLRHTFCSVGLSKGVDVKVMSEFMGHSKTDITLNIYTHTTELQKKEALRKLNMTF